MNTRQAAYQARLIKDGQAGRVSVMLHEPHWTKWLALCAQHGGPAPALKAIIDASPPSQ